MYMLLTIMSLVYNLGLFSITKICYATECNYGDMLASDETINDQEMTDLDRIFADQDLYDFDLKYDILDAYDYDAKFSEQSMFEFENYFIPKKNDQLSECNPNSSQNRNIHEYKKPSRLKIDEHGESISEQMTHEKVCDSFTRDNKQDQICKENLQCGILPSNFSFLADIEVSSGEEKLSNNSSNKLDEIEHHSNQPENTSLYYKGNLNSELIRAARDIKTVEVIYNVELDHNYCKHRSMDTSDDPKHQCNKSQKIVKSVTYNYKCTLFNNFAILIEDYLKLLVSKETKLTKKICLNGEKQQTHPEDYVVTRSRNIDTSPNIFCDFVVDSSNDANDIEITKGNSSMEIDFSQTSNINLRTRTGKINSKLLINLENNVQTMAATEINTIKRTGFLTYHNHVPSQWHSHISNEDNNMISAILNAQEMENKKKTSFSYENTDVIYKLEFVPYDSKTRILISQIKSMKYLKNLCYLRKRLTENDIDSFYMRIKKDLICAYDNIYGKDFADRSKIQELAKNQQIICHKYIESGIGYGYGSCDYNQFITKIFANDQNDEEIIKTLSIPFKLHFLVYVETSKPMIASNERSMMFVDLNCICNNTPQGVEKIVNRAIHCGFSASNTSIINDDLYKNIKSITNTLYTPENLQKIMRHIKALENRDFIKYLKNEKMCDKNTVNLNYRYTIDLNHLNYLNNDHKKLRGWFLLKNADLVWLGHLQKHISIIIEQVKFLISKSVINYDIYFTIVYNETIKIMFDGNLRKHKERIFQYLKALLDDKDTNIFILLPGYPLLSESLNIKENLQYLNNDAEIFYYLSFLHIFSLILKIEWSEIRFLKIEPENHIASQKIFLHAYNYIINAYQVSLILLYLIKPYVKQSMFSQILLFMEIEMVIYNVILKQNMHFTSKQYIFEFKLKRYSFISKCVMTNDIFLYEIISLKSPNSKKDPLIQFYASSYCEKSFYTNITFGKRVKNVIILINLYCNNLCMFKLSETMKKVILINIYALQDLSNWTENYITYDNKKKIQKLEKDIYNISIKSNIDKHFKIMDIIDKYILSQIL